jgi:hypothetical protein
MIRQAFSAVTLAMAIGGSALLPATAVAGEGGGGAVTIRFFDRDHHDYHRWNRSEDVRYRAYLAERHRRYLAFQRASRERQREYWRWRHVHER